MAMFVIADNCVISSCTIINENSFFIFDEAIVK